MTEKIAKLNGVLIAIVVLELVAAVWWINRSADDSAPAQLVSKEPESGVTADPLSPRGAGISPMPRLDGYNRFTAARLRERFNGNSFASASDWADWSDLVFTHGFYPTAAACMQRACDMEPQNADLAYRCGFLLSSMGRTEEARTLFKHAISLGSKNEDACWYFVGRDYLREENVDAATEAFGKASKLDAVQWHLAKLALKRGDAVEAKKIISTVQLKNPKVFAVNMVRSHAERDLGNPKEAKAYADLAELSTELLDTPFFGLRAKFLKLLDQNALGGFVETQRRAIENGDVRAALLAIEDVLGDRWEPQVEDLLATADYATGNLARQQQRLQQIIARDSGTTYRYWRLGMALKVDGKQEQALSAFKAGLRLDGGQRMRDCRDEVIKIYEERGEIGLAKFHVARFAYLDGVEALYRGQVDLAKAALTKSVEINPTYPHAWYYLGRCERFLGNVGAAKAAHLRCLEANPNHGRAHVELESLP